MFHSKTESLGLTTISKHEKANESRMPHSRQIFWVFVFSHYGKKGRLRFDLVYRIKMTINHLGRLAIHTC